MNDTSRDDILYTNEDFIQLQNSLLDKNCVGTPEQCQFIFFISFICLISFFYAIYRKYYYLAPVPGSVFLTSLNYWKKPRYNSWERHLDMSVVGIALLYQSYFALKSNMRVYYFFTIFLAIICYLISKTYVYISERYLTNINDNIYKKNKLKWIAIYYHAGLHILANAANIILYSGKIG
jgi:hypothetical protein